MNDSYIAQKTEEIIFYFNAIATIEKRDKFIKLILEAVWLDGMGEGIQKVKEIINK